MALENSQNHNCVFILKGAPDMMGTPCDLAGAAPGAGPHSQEGCFSVDNWRRLFLSETHQTYFNTQYTF